MRHGEVTSERGSQDGPEADGEARAPGPQPRVPVAEALMNRAPRGALGTGQKTASPGRGRPPKWERGGRCAPAPPTAESPDRPDQRAHGEGGGAQAWIAGLRDPEPGRIWGPTSLPACPESGF